MNDHRLLQIIAHQRDKIADLKEEKLELARKLRRAEERMRQLEDQCSGGE